MRARRLLMILAVCFLVGGIVVAPIAVPVASAATTPDFTPSPNKWRKWMLNQLSSVLGNAMPSAWKAENLANQMLYDHSWEQWEAQLGIDGVDIGPDGKPKGIKWTNRNTGTYEDVVIENFEQKYKDKYKMMTAQGGPKYAVPATTAGTLKKLLRGAGGALAVVTAYDLSTMLTAGAVNTVGGWFGWDSNGVTCNMFSDGSFGSWIGRTLSGQDCTAWDLAQQYVPNGDEPLGYSDLTWSGGTWVFMGTRTFPNGFVGYCWTAGPPAQYPLSGPWSDTIAGNQGAPGVISDCSGGNRLSETGLYILNGAGEKIAETEEIASDPEHVVRCTVTMTDGTSVSADGEPYHESGGELAPAPCPAVPDGKVPASVSLTEVTDGQPDRSLMSQPVGEDAQQMFSDYQECMYGSCALDLLKISDPAAPSCFDLEAGCPGWWADPQRNTNYQCRYGVHIVAIQECAVYSGLFEPGRVATDSPYSDPSTGVWSGGKNTPGAGVTAMSRPLQDPNAVRGCDLSDIGLDPIGWVLRPGQCLMEWAFAPRPTVVEVAFAGAGEAWEGKPPQVIAEFVETAALSPSASGCSRAVTLFGVTFNIIDACSGPMADVAGISRLVTSAGMVVLVLVVLKRQIAAMVGYNQGQG